MFTPIISDLKDGKLPDNNLLRKRFEAALIKKMGVIKTPYPFWSSDTKINPPAKQLLWAAILLQDRDNFNVIEAIISSELEERLRAKGQPESMQTLDAKVQQLLQEYIHEFIDLAPDEKFKKNLDQLTQAVMPV
ncbi:MAG: hypothetical protein AMJ61_10190 [Desulfobacterales bacterium SG8_35_2]|nr:MAG: hypothetical protein AMJ61_10190 [Desulfobacterales bacterium SG8_35_2]